MSWNKTMPRLGENWDPTCFGKFLVEVFSAPSVVLRLNFTPLSKSKSLCHPLPPIPMFSTNSMVGGNFPPCS